MQGYVRSATVERALEWIRNRGSVQVNDGLAGITLPYRPPAWRPEATYCSVGAPLVSFLARLGDGRQWRAGNEAPHTFVRPCNS
jgi:hypothetical protein